MPGQQRALSGICGALGMGEHHPGDGGASLWGLGSIAWGGGDDRTGGRTDGHIAPGMEQHRCRGMHCPRDG